MKQNFEWRVLFGKNRRAGIRVSILLALALVLGTLPLDVSGGGTEDEAFIEEFATEEPTVDESAAAQSIADESTVDEPITDESTTDGILTDDGIQLQTASGEATSESDFSWGSSQTESWVVKYNGTAEDVTVPSTYQGKPVTKINQGAFQGNTTIKSVTLPEGLTAIGNSVFHGCTSLMTVVMPDSLKKIGYNVFYECKSLVTAKIPSGVESIGYQAFYSCTSLQSDIIIPNCTSLEQGAFWLCSSVKTIELSPNLKAIPRRIFKNCEKLESITIPDSVESIGEYAFEFCSSLRSITLPDNVKTLGINVFNQCASLASVKLPSGLEEIPSRAFAFNKQLESIEIPESVTQIGSYAFSSSALASIELPEGIQTISEDAFASCNLSSITIPEGIGAISDGAFMNCYELENVTLPSGLKTIGEYAFTGNHKLASIEIPNGVTSIGTNAFTFCWILKKLEIPDSVMTIGNRMYDSDTLDLFIYPENLDISNAPSGSGTNTSKVRYQTDSDGNAIVDSIELGRWKTKVEIPDTIAGRHVLLVEESFRDKVSENGHTHRGGMPTCTEPAHCVICNAKQDGDFVEKEHQYGEASVGNDGTHSKTCSVCGDVQTEECVYEYSTVASTLDGHTGTCEVCGYSALAEDHTYGEWVKESDILYTRTCSVCGYKASAAITALLEEVRAEYGKTAEEVLTVTVVGAAADYQWSLEGEEIEGATADSLLLPDAMEPGEYAYQCRVTLEGNRESSVFSFAVTVVAADLHRADITFTDTEEIVYDGSGKKPGFTVEMDGKPLEEGKDFTVSYENNVNVGEAVLTIEGKGFYTNSKTQGYTIAPAIPQISWEQDAWEVEYTAKEAEIPALVVTLVGEEKFNGIIKYFYAENGSDSYISGLPVESGSYTVKAQVAAAGNYAAAESKGLALTIIKPECKHGNTVLKNAVDAECEKEGYTGDTCCAECGIMLMKGEKIPALEHEWEEKVIKQPTVQEEGVKRYTCSRCDKSYEESIAKLPGVEATPTPGVEITPTPGVEATPTPGGEATPTPGVEVTPTPGVEITPTPGVEVTPTPGVEITPTPGVEVTPTPGVEVTPTPGVEITPTPGVEVTPTPGSETTPTPGGEATPTPEGEATPTPRVEATPTPGTHPDEGKPFIREESGTEDGTAKVGWAAILAETEMAGAGSTITVDMNTTTIVPENMWKYMYGKDIVVFFDLGEGILWRVNGQSVVLDQVRDIDFSAKTGMETIPAELVKQVAQGYHSMQLNLTHEGIFGFQSFLGINLGEENAGFHAVLYYYNENNKKLEQISMSEIALDGMAWLEFTHASDYLVVVECDKDGTEEKTDEGDKTGDQTEREDQGKTDGDTKEDDGGQTKLPETGFLWNRKLFFIIGAIIFFMGLGMVFYDRKEKKMMTKP